MGKEEHGRLGVIFGTVALSCGAVTGIKGSFFNHGLGAARFASPFLFVFSLIHEEAAGCLRQMTGGDGMWMGWSGLNPDSLAFLYDGVR